ncbi:MAG: hypothetical protein RBR24_10265 [Candidatus Carbobacillus sp.]|jgi:hypothetical protein|nr:hypothetical protein [Candidatus Carbobacillus sp.]
MKKYFIAFCITTVFLIVFNSCSDDENSQFYSENLTVSESVSKSPTLPPHEIETFFYDLEGRIDCNPPATNCTIIIITPGKSTSINDFVIENESNSFLENSIVIQEHKDFLSNYIFDITVLDKIIKGDLFAKFIVDNNNFWLITLEKPILDFEESDVYGAWLFSEL